MNYDKDILRVLTEAGTEGLSIQKISRHVFNSSNSFFCPISYDKVYSYVASYLKRNSHNPNSIIEKTSTRGVYRLNMESQLTQQLMLEFKDFASEESDEPVQTFEDGSLSLF